MPSDEHSLINMVADTSVDPDVVLHRRSTSATRSMYVVRPGSCETTLPNFWNGVAPEEIARLPGKRIISQQSILRNGIICS